MWASFPSSPPSFFFIRGQSHSSRAPLTILSLSSHQSRWPSFCLENMTSLFLPPSYWSYTFFCLVCPFSVACYSLTVLSSNVTTKSSLPILGHSLMWWYLDGFSSWFLSLSCVTLMIHLLVFIICLPSQPIDLWKQKPWLLPICQHLVPTSCSISIGCVEVVEPPWEMEEPGMAVPRSNDTGLWEYFGNYHTQCK